MRLIHSVSLLVLTTLGSALATAQPFTHTLLQDDALWGDGMAEVVVFDAKERRYGVLRDTEVRHIAVGEDFAANAQVKSDDWKAPGTYPVLKLNQIITVPTGSYRYDQGHSSFWHLSDGQLIKFASTTNDSCGLSYKQGNLQNGQWRYRAFTYWESMEDVEATATAPAGALTYDELPFKLRTLDWGKVTLFEAPLLETIIDSKGDSLTWTPAAFAVERTPDGWRVTVKHAKGTDRLTFDRTSPHTLRRWLRWDGSTLERKHLIRLPYWQLNQPGDERYLRPGSTYP